MEVAKIRLGHCFKRMCSKVIDVRELPALQTDVAETMALLEVHLPLAFWNVMPHLVLHLPREIYWYGPVHSRWMYCAERYIGHLKSLVRNKARLEGSIAMGYIMEETLGFVTKHFRLYPVRARVIWEMEDDERETSEVLEGKGIKRRWPKEELVELHEHIICHSVITERFYRCSLCDFLFSIQFHNPLRTYPGLVLMMRSRYGRRCVAEIFSTSVFYGLQYTTQMRALYFCDHSNVSTIAVSTWLTAIQVKAEYAFVTLDSTSG